MKMSAGDIARYPKFHNYVKWGSNSVINGVDDPVPGDPLNEEGSAFELEIYGKIIAL